MSTNASTALITRGMSGIGRATANKLAELGIDVLVVGRNVERGDKTAAEIRAAGDEADLIFSDLGDASSTREVARRAVELGNGRVDILINNAGVFPLGPTQGTREETFDSVYSLNVKRAYFLGRGTRSADGGEGQRGNRQCIDDGCRLRGIRHEPLWLEQGRHQPAD